MFNTEYLDKTLVNYANVMGLQEDAGINGTWFHTATHNRSGHVELIASLDSTGNQFSQLAMIFYVSYLACEFPHAYGMQTLPTAKYLGTMVVLVSHCSTSELSDINLYTVDVID